MKDIFVPITKKRSILYIALIFLVFLIIRISNSAPFLSDSYEYIETSKLIKNFDYFFNTNTDYTLLTKRPFVYPLFLALTHNFSPYITILIQTLLSLFSFYILIKTVEKLNLKTSNLFLLLLICTPSIFIYTQLLMSEWLVMLWLHILFYLIVSPWSKINFFFIQLLTLLLAFTKPVFYPLIYFNFLFFTFYFVKKKGFSIYLVFPLLVLQLYLNYNEKKTGFRHFSSIENINLINYNLYYFKSSQLGKEKADAWKSNIYNNPALDTMNFKQRSEYLQKKGFETIKENLFSYGWYHIKNSFRGLIDPGRFDLMTFFQKETKCEGFLEILNGNKSFFSLFNNKWAILYLLLIPVALVNIIKWGLVGHFVFTHFSKMSLLNYYLFFYLLGYILLTGPINCSRFMMPLQGIAIVISLCQINFLYSKAKKQ